MSKVPASDSIAQARVLIPTCTQQCLILAGVIEQQGCRPLLTAKLPSLHDFECLCSGCRQHLHAAEGKAMEDQENAKKRFRDWVKTKVPDAEYMNICSGPQVTCPALPASASVM